MSVCDLSSKLHAQKQVSCDVNGRHKLQLTLSSDDHDDIHSINLNRISFQLSIISSSGSSGRVRGGPRNMKSMRPPSAAIFFMTYFHRARGGHSAPPSIIYHFYSQFHHLLIPSNNRFCSCMMIPTTICQSTCRILKRWTFKILNTSDK